MSKIKNFIGGVVGGVVKPVATAITEVKKSREETKQLEIKTQSKLDLSQEEWDLITLRNQKDSWKDEFVTVVWMSPVIFIIIGAVSNAWGPSTLIAEMERAIAIINSMFMSEGEQFSYGEVLLYVTLAALGLKGLMNKIKGK